MLVNVDAIGLVDEYDPRGFGFLHISSSDNGIRIDDAVSIYFEQHPESCGLYIHFIKEKVVKNG